MTTEVNAMTTKELAFCDLEREIAATRRVLGRVPEEQFCWKPHEKSMSAGRMAMHVATNLQWFLMTLEGDGLDMASPPSMPMEATSSKELMATFEQNAAACRAALAKIDEGALVQTWTLRQGAQVLYAAPRVVVLRVWCLNHLIHHRGQLCVYLRLLNLPVPAVYFNSTDEPEWKFE